MREHLDLPLDNLPGVEIDLESTAAILDLPEVDRGGCAVLLAHGSGAPMDSPFMEAIATGLRDRGAPVLRFHYAYMHKRTLTGGMRPPDRAPKLEAVHTRALEHLRSRFPGRRTLLIGKSLGGRMGSHIAAKGEACAGLAFLGYPLHPPKKPEKERSEHFPTLCQPTLFLQGTRDALCDLELLARALPKLGGPCHLEVIEGGNHSFDVLKSLGKSPEMVRADLCDRIVAWESNVLGA